jgi:hypothetical protein
MVDGSRHTRELRLQLLGEVGQRLQVDEERRLVGHRWGLLSRAGRRSGAFDESAAWWMALSRGTSAPPPTSGRSRVDHAK